MKKRLYRYRFVFLPFGIAAILSLVSFVIMQLWNHLLPDIFNVGAITFWQAMGLFVLCKILFGFGGRGKMGGGGPPWMRRRGMMEEKFRGMSPEDRERFKQKWQDRCNWGRRGRGAEWMGKEEAAFEKPGTDEQRPV